MGGKYSVEETVAPDAARGVRLERRFLMPWLGIDPHSAHHSAVFMFEQMAVIHESAYYPGIAEVHLQFDGRVLSAVAVPVRNIDRIAQKGFVQWYAIPL